MALKVCSVDFLNSSPLVWGLLHGPQKGYFDLTFAIPSRCAELLQSGEVDIGNVPVIECARQGLEFVHGAGVACRGPVRSILLISSKPPEEIRTLAADSSSRTSVELCRIVLARRYGVRPELLRHPPDLNRMLELADAALIIGDPALHLDPASMPYRVLDLGDEWWKLTGLPMVFAVWAGRAKVITPEVETVLLESCRYGRAHLDDVIAAESVTRQIDVSLARRYLTGSIVNELGPREHEGLRAYLEAACELGLLSPGSVTADRSD